MNPEEKERIRQITQALDLMLQGKIPQQIARKNDSEDEIGYLSEKINILIQNLKDIREFILPLSQGKLNISLPKQNFLASPFKTLHAALRHLTWQTRQVAKGDFDQKVDFMGDFSDAFNSMTDSLKEARDQLTAETDRFKKLAEIRENYLNVMAHDIRTPIGAMIGFAEILLEGNLSDTARKYIEIIHKNSDSLLGLINNILDMAKLEKRKMEIESLPFSLKTLCEDIRNIILPKLAQNIEFIIDTDCRIPEVLLGDPYRLRQVLMNLAANAAKFTRQGQIILKTSVIASTQNSFEILFSVSDTGMGIPQNRLETIFMPFAQADKSIASRFGGTGLGLAISRELVSLMRGNLEVRSRLGEGTEFYFTITMASAEATDDARQNAGCFKRGNILVVDDNSDVLNLIGHTLSKEGIRYSLCQDSRQAFDMLAEAYRRKDPFTLVWLDIDMPGVSGFDLAAKIRADQRFSNIHLIACTSHAESVGEVRHFSFIAAKPLTQQALRRILDEAVGGHSAECSLDDVAGLKLLVADDNPLNRFLVVHLMKKINVDVVEAENGFEAVGKLAQEQFDAVLMDRMMPVMDGVETISRIRETYTREELPIFGFIASDSENDKEEMLSAGANGIIAKPIAYENMLENLCRIIEK